jgi:hypothetical protein
VTTTTAAIVTTTVTSSPTKTSATSPTATSPLPASQIRRYVCHHSNVCSWGKVSSTFTFLNETIQRCVQKSWACH